MYLCYFAFFRDFGFMSIFAHLFAYMAVLVIHDERYEIWGMGRLSASC